MWTRRPLSIALCLPVAVLLAAPALRAQKAPSKVELTPFAGYQLGGSFDEDFEDFDDDDFFDDVDVEESESYGLMLDFSLAPNAQLEFLYSYQDTRLEEGQLFGADLADVEIEYLHVGILWQWLPRNEVRPYVVLSAGATRFGLAGDSDTRLSAGLGGGVKIFFGDHFGLRFDGRLYSTFVDEGEEIECGRRNCYRYEDDLTFIQADVKAGLIFAF